jgi:hypothetical protein
MDLTSLAVLPRNRQRETWGRRLGEEGLGKKAWGRRLGEEGLGKAGASRAMICRVGVLPMRRLGLVLVAASTLHPRESRGMLTLPTQASVAEVTLAPRRAGRCVAAMAATWVRRGRAGQNRSGVGR